MRQVNKNSFEVRYFFEICTNLKTARRDNISSIVEFHRNELVAMKMHTTNNVLRRACIKTLADHDMQVSAAAATA